MFYRIDHCCKSLEVFAISVLSGMNQRDFICKRNRIINNENICERVIAPFWPFKNVNILKKHFPLGLFYSIHYSIIKSLCSVIGDEWVIYKTIPDKFVRI